MKVNKLHSFMLRAITIFLMLTLPGCHAWIQEKAEPSMANVFLKIRLKSDLATINSSGRKMDSTLLINEILMGVREIRFIEPGIPADGSETGNDNGSGTGTGGSETDTGTNTGSNNGTGDSGTDTGSNSGSNTDADTGNTGSNPTNDQGTSGPESGDSNNGNQTGEEEGTEDEEKDEDEQDDDGDSDDDDDDERDDDGDSDDDDDDERDDDGDNDDDDDDERDDDGDNDDDDDDERDDDGDSDDDDDDERDDDGDSDGDDRMAENMGGASLNAEIIFTGGFAVDMIRGTSVPDFGIMEVIPGTYHRIVIESGPYLENENTLYIELEFYENGEGPVYIEYSSRSPFTIDVQNAEGIQLDGGSFIQILLLLDFDKLFAGVDFSLATPDPDGIVRINNNANEDIWAIIESQIGTAFEAGPDLNGDGQIDTSEGI